MGLVVNFKTMQQPTNLVTFFQIREYSRDYRHRELVYFFIIAACIVFIIIVINSQLAFKFDRQVYIDRVATCHS